VKPEVTLIGPGRVGGAIGRRLYQAGYRLNRVIGTRLKQTEEACRFIGCPPTCASTRLADATGASLLLLAVPDDHIASVAAAIEERLTKNSPHTLVHFSGVQAAASMPRKSGATQRLSIHPLLPFADRASALSRLPGCPCALEGDSAALPLGKELIAAIGGRSFLLSNDSKALYHAAACIASNYLVTLVDRAGQLLQQCGIANDQTTELLLPLLSATLENIAHQGTGAGLTGPIVRADFSTIQQHQQVLAKTSAVDLSLYRHLGQLTLSLARKAGRLSSRQTEELSKILALTDQNPAV
jgi:predicted short-subunit dehydrogenase-like oxidoreductase (DUF2520 family)